MRVVKKVFVPADDVEIVTWQCDVPGCDYETDDEDLFKDHFGNVHAVRAKCVILKDDLDPIISRSITLYWFEFEDHAKAWLDSTKNEYCEIRRVAWVGPGWYREVYSAQSCSKGCCRDSVVELESIETHIDETRKTARRLLEHASEVDAAVKALEAP